MHGAARDNTAGVAGQPARKPAGYRVAHSLEYIS